MQQRELIYYVAQSLDGYIADANGSVDWLQPFENSGENYGYDEFYGSIDSLVMGGNTYRFIEDAGKWPYQGKPSWLLSKSINEVMDPSITISTKSAEETLAEIHQHGYTKTWLVGGSKLAASFLNCNAITQYIITIIPVILGKGLPILSAPASQQKLELQEKQTYASGVIQLTFIPRLSHQ